MSFPESRRAIKLVSPSRSSYAYIVLRLPGYEGADRTVVIPPLISKSLETKMTAAAERIRSLNDDLRRNLSIGTAVMTLGVAALGPALVERVVRAVATFEDFNDENDPHGEHDFGMLNVEGHRLFYKIDYFDKSLTVHSPDPADPNVTERVITLMLAEEY
jgi:hypothetical protein